MSVFFAGEFRSTQNKRANLAGDHSQCALPGAYRGVMHHDFSDGGLRSPDLVPLERGKQINVGGSGGKELRHGRRDDATYWEEIVSFLQLARTSCGIFRQNPTHGPPPFAAATAHNAP